MTLEKLTLAQAKQYVAGYPLMLTGSNSSGKTYALEQMSTEYKKRTVCLNFDMKPIGENTSDEFYQVYSVAATSDTINKQITFLNTKGKTLVESGTDKKSPILAKLREHVTHLQGLKKTSYFIDDPEAVDKIVEGILTNVTFNTEVDRVVVDTFSSLVDFCEAWATKNFSGREIWGAYGSALQRIMQAVKEATIFGCKYTYFFAHHDFIPALQYATTPKKVVEVKGGIMKGNVEMHFATIVYAYVTEEGKRMFACDVNNSLDTSRTKLPSGEFTFERTSLDDLEQILSGSKKVVEEQLVALDYKAPVVEVEKK